MRMADWGDRLLGVLLPMGSAYITCNKFLPSWLFAWIGKTQIDGQVACAPCTCPTLAFTLLGLVHVCNHSKSNLGP